MFFAHIIPYLCIIIRNQYKTSYLWHQPTKPRKPPLKERRTDSRPKAGEAQRADSRHGAYRKTYGRGAIMKLGDDNITDVDVIPSGSISLNFALGVGGFPRGRITEIYGPESSGKTTLALHAIAEAQKKGGIAALIDAEHAFDRFYAAKLGVDVDNLLISQPDTGEQALEIVEQLIRSSAIRHNRSRLGSRAYTESRNRRRYGRPQRRPTGTTHVAGHAQTHGSHRTHQHMLHIHQPAACRNRRHGIRPRRNHHRRQRPQVLRVRAYRYTPVLYTQGQKGTAHRTTCQD